MSYTKMKVAELKAECTKLGLDAKGTKAELVARLEAHGDANDAGDDEPAPVAKKGKAAAKAKAPKGKATKRKAAEEEEEEEEEAAAGPVDVKAELQKKAKAAAPPKAGQLKIDPGCHLGGEIYQDYKAMLNQTNINANNNKFYVVEVHAVGSGYRCWTHWGRVGETGQNKAESFSNAAAAVKAFESKFKSKTGNNWADRDNFVPKSGKYTLLLMAAGGDDEEAAAMEEKLDDLAKSAVPRNVAKSKLDKTVQEVVSLIFDHNMFKEQMSKLEIDTKKMPLGQLSPQQLLLGYNTLEKLEDAIENGNRSAVEQLTSQFYTQIPHSFGRTKPPVLSSKEDVQRKYDMLNILSDIATTTKSEKDTKTKSKNEEEQPNPLDQSYATLDCDLTPLDPKSKEWKTIQEYTKNTGNSGGWRSCKILEIFEVNRHSEGKRFSIHNKVGNRKLLWHGTNVAVVAAILKTGLRIMPHSGGRVGKGIYCASENSKSAGYVGTTGDGIGFMFLNEVVLGKEHHITRDDSSLKAAPAGCQSVVAQGQHEPDPAGDVEFKMDGHTVVVPAGKPVDRPKYANSNFDQSEYLVYQEDQVRIRYMIRAKFH